jgi:hypothetical protein
MLQLSGWNFCLAVSSTPKESGQIKSFRPSPCVFPPTRTPAQPPTHTQKLTPFNPTPTHSQLRPGQLRTVPDGLLPVEHGLDHVRSVPLWLVRQRSRGHQLWNSVPGLLPRN